jgi:hypothetical protein
MQQRAPVPYSEPDESSPRTHHRISLKSISIVHFLLTLCLNISLFPLGFTTKPWLHLSSLPYTTNVPTTHSYFYLMIIKNQKSSQFVVFSSSLLPRPSQVQISSSAPYSLTSSAYVLPSVLQTKFPTHTNQ